jgi:SP family myo-inositol transporter-like MFS transporter 13
MYSEKPSGDSKLDKDEFVETVDRRRSVSDEATELSAIEATAASKAAWLIALTVSIGGFLFGASYSEL